MECLLCSQHFLKGYILVSESLCGIFGLFVSFYRCFQAEFVEHMVWTPQRLFYSYGQSKMSSLRSQRTSLEMVCKGINLKTVPQKFKSDLF